MGTVQPALAIALQTKAAASWVDLHWHSSSGSRLCSAEYLHEQNAFLVCQCHSSGHSLLAWPQTVDAVITAAFLLLLPVVQ